MVLLELQHKMVMVMVTHATFNNISISWRTVLMMEEAGGTRENHRPAARDYNIIVESRANYRFFSCYKLNTTFLHSRYLNV